MSIFHRDWAGDAAELTRLLSLCGIAVNTVLCAGCSIQELSHLATAEINLVVHEEFADGLAPFLKSQLGTASLKPTAGAPIGFQQTGQWIYRNHRSLSTGHDRYALATGAYIE